MLYKDEYQIRSNSIWKYRHWGDGKKEIIETYGKPLKSREEYRLICKLAGKEVKSIKDIRNDEQLRQRLEAELGELFWFSWRVYDFGDRWKRAVSR